ncbi:hypothetical protein [Novosphingobium sp. EMRT-2]|uniref:DUF6950 family protein n=1 Tax=Novosphingobium sp. EMRT-2 TaxID=2571749 RepID=UPI0010BE0217|nr:hypothetical protein [Novosphingobium sp. EMRT-2]QCI92319.1 hypothetical protein FA702_01205 [Novosphingobium sp. EMRT-2]
MSALVRHGGWEQALADYLLANRDAVFAWGRIDCVLFCAGAIGAMTGIDPAAGMRGRYATPIGARRVMTRMGWKDVPAIAAAHFVEIGPASASRGDVVFDGRSLGVCIGRVACFVGEEDGMPGLVQLSLSQWTRAWRVPFSI